MADKYIVHKTTRVIRVITSRENPELQRFEEAVPVNVKLSFPPGSKLNPDNVSTSPATPEDLRTTMEDYRPQERKRRIAIEKINAVLADPALPAVLKDALSAIKDMYVT